MNRLILVFPTVLALAILSCGGPGADTQPTLDPYRAPAIPNAIEGVVFEAGSWEPHLPAGEQGVSWGNHRAVVVFDDVTGAEPDAVLVTIPWRRHDPTPATKGIVVVDAATQEPVANAMALRVENASGDVVFQPNSGSPTYHVYYMPWQSTGGYYPTITYPTPAALRNPTGGEGATRDSPSRAEQGGRADLSWAGLVSVNQDTWEVAVGARPPEELPRARTTHIQSVNDFHSFFPMEVIATEEETAAFMADQPNGWAVVPEHRDYPVRMRGYLPQHWVKDPAPTFESKVLRDEAFAFQLALVSGAEELGEVRLTYLDFPTPLLESITCFNCEGVNEKGEAFTKEIRVPAGSAQPLWIGIAIPPDLRPGPVTGTIEVATANRGSRIVQVSLDVLEGRAINHGYDDPELQTRLAWLNSTVGSDPDFIIEPFEPVGVDAHSLSILGRRIDLGNNGLPEQIFSYFTPEMTGFAEEPEPVLATPLAMSVLGADGEAVEFEPSPFQVLHESRGRVAWSTTNTSPDLEMTVEGRLEYDGMLEARIRLLARSDLTVQDIALPIALHPDAAEYMLGLGHKGGRRPGSIDWKWAVENHQEGAWLGGVHKGLQYVLRDENYVRPLNTNFYRNQPLNLPPSWFNEGRGGIRVFENETDGSVIAHNYSGPRTIGAGEALHFNVRFLLTPFKPVDTQTHFNTRFVHKYVPVDSVREWGGTVVNIHHANEINPFINYPFFNLEQQKAYIDEAHEKKIKVKLYNTIRELTYKAHELFAMRSLGDEILNDGEGGGHSWMQEHLEDHYHSAWHAWRVDDAAMLNKGTSRWTNYYISGLSWLAEHQQIDGLYLDDIAFSRETVKRLVSVLDEHRAEVVIDLHSANQFNVRDGFINSAFLYMEHFPFISRLWFGEYFEYDLDEDYWLTEVSGLPFGLMGEMLQDGGHPHRGMLYGMTARLYGDVDPRPVWDLMNDFGIADSRMMGYWLDDPPVTTNHPRVKATAFVRPDEVLVALASWSDNDEVVSLRIDPSVVHEGRAFAPFVEGLQEEALIDLSRVPVPANQGLFVIIGSEGS